MDREEGNHDISSVYVYNGVDEVPMDVTHVKVDPSITVIPDNSLLQRQKLKVVELPEGLIRIEEKAFFGCESLISINLPSTLTHIGNQAFGGCELDDIVLPEGLQTLGSEAFCDCKSLQRISIPPNLERIGRGAFLYCSSLADVSFSEGLRRIEEDGFSRCTTLASVTLPSSLKVIGVEAFEGCDQLNEVYMPDSIESIHARAFKYCNFTNFRMPTSAGNDINMSIVGCNASLVSLQLPETIGNLDDVYNSTGEHTDLSVRNIALPSDCNINTIGLGNLKDLRVVFSVDENDTTISEALQHRFDDLPIHKVCYYQSYYDNETTMQSLKRKINPWTTKPPGQLNKSGKDQDCLGMTPLHILACSTKPTIEMFRLLIEKYPETLIMKDKWGDIPLLYAIWCNATSEVIDLLVESYKSLHQKYEFNWGSTLLTLSERDVPLANIQKLVIIQQNSFPDQEYDMQQVVIELAASNATQASLQKPYTSIETFKYLLRASITKRLDLLSVTKWREDLRDIINVLPDKANYRNEEVKNREEYIKGLYDKLATYEPIKEGTSILEMALWKYKIDESRNKKARVDGDVSYKEQCRVNCGADIIIRNVLPYLIPKPFFSRKTKF